MALQDTSLNPKIFNSAKKEFLKKGFLKASLRSIARDAGVSTGALYRRYKKKDDLFEAVVQPALDLLNKGIIEYDRNYFKDMSREKFYEILDSSLEFTQGVIRLLYTEKDALKILFAKAEGTKHSNFLYDFVEKNAQKGFSSLTKMKKTGMVKTTISFEAYYILMISYWVAIAEIFRQDFTLEKALVFSKDFDKFFNWQGVIKFTK